MCVWLCVCVCVCVFVCLCVCVSVCVCARLPVSLCDCVSLAMCLCLSIDRSIDSDGHLLLLVLIMERAVGSESGGDGIFECSRCRWRTVDGGNSGNSGGRWLLLSVTSMEAAVGSDSVDDGNVGSGSGSSGGAGGLIHVCMHTSACTRTCVFVHCVYLCVLCMCV